MSSSIWTQCGAKSNFCSRQVKAVRVVEAQHRNSTRKLVDSDDEQEALEHLLDASKPSSTPASLHYLLATPFRYPPLRHGSRFGRRHERGIWYGSRKLSTAFAETAYYRLLFLQGSTADLAPLHVELTTFTAPMHSSKAIDLTDPPFAEHTAVLASPSSYAETHALGSAMRDDGVELVVFTSARDPERGDNIAAFTPDVFAAKRPSSEQRWFCTVAAEAVEIREGSMTAADARRYRFERAVFAIDGAIPAPSA